MAEGKDLLALSFRHSSLQSRMLLSVLTPPSVGSQYNAIENYLHIPSTRSMSAWVGGGRPNIRRSSLHDERR
jgi:hypothetical protein